MATEEAEDRRNITLIWRIENLSYWRPGGVHGREIISGYFNPLCMNGAEIDLSMFPKGKDHDDPHLQVGLNFFSSDLHTKYSIDCEWSLLDDVGTPLATETLRNQIFSLGKPVSMQSCPTYEEVFVTKKSSFLPLDTLTVRCRIWKSHRDLEQAEHFSARTRINVEEKSFKWSIQEFSSLQLGQKVTTEVVISDDSVFLLCFSLTGASLEEARVNFQITKVKIGNVKLKLNVSILKDEKVMKCVERECAFSYFIREQTWDLPKFESRKEILNITSDWLCGEDLNLLCTFAVQESVEHFIDSYYCGPTNLKIEIPRLKPKKCTNTKSQSSDRSDSPQRKKSSTAVLLDDFLTLYKDQTLFDFELRSGDASFPVHKNVLSARSPVFRAMFCDDMQEANSSSQDVPDVDTHTLNRMLTFLYSGTVDDLQWESAAKLYYAADKYQVLSLKQESLSILRSGLSVSNVSDILELADRHQDQEMTSFVHDYLMIHYDEIVLSSEWERFVERNGSLAGKTMMEIYKKKLQK